MGNERLPGQTTDGKWHQQTDDCILALRYARSLEQCTGFVGTLGGSGSGHHALYLAVTGVVGDDRSDAAICMSPVTDFSDREGDTTTEFVQIVTQYNRGETDSGILLARSPAGLMDNTCSPILHYNGDAESMPLSQLTRVQNTASGLGIVSPQYTSVENTGTLGTRHSFGMWNPPDIPGIRDDAKAWLLDRIAEWTPGGGGGEPPPPPTPTRELITVSITGLDPGTPMEFTAAAKSKESGAVGPSTPFDFISDRDDNAQQTKDPAKGVWVIAPQSGGIPPDLTLKPWWAFDYVDGVRLYTRWSIVEPTFRTFDWTVLDSFLLLCASNSKLGAFSIPSGILTQSWVYGRQVESFTFSNGSKMPLPWDENYQRLYQEMIKSAAKRFDGHPALAYVVACGFGQAESCFLVDSTDYSALNTAAVDAGYTGISDAFTQTTQHLLNYWSQAFRSTKVVIDIDFPVPEAQQGLDIMDQILLWSAQTFRSRVNFFNAQLTGATDDSGMGSLIKKYAMQTQTGFGFRYPASDPNCDPTQDPVGYDPELGLRNAADAGSGLGAAWEEFQESDILITDAPYPDDFTQFQTDLYANSLT